MPRIRHFAVRDLREVLKKGVEDFAVLDVSTGIGLGVMLGGRLLTGHSGLAGEIGHITVVPQNGRPCGCGNTGCLETVASDSALAYHAGRKLGRAVSVDEVLDLVRAGAVDLSAELNEVADYLGIAVAAVVNLFNPAVVFVYSPLLDLVAALVTVSMEQESLRLVPMALLYRFVFILFLDVVKTFATLEELFRLDMGWAKLQRVAATG